MKTTIKQALIGAAAILAITGANAATVSLLPLDPALNVGETIGITVRGTDFFEGASGGTVTITWNAAELALASTEAEINASAATNTFVSLSSTNPVKTPGNLEATYGSFAVPSPGPDFDFFTLTFLALSPSLADIGIDLGLGGHWQDGNFQDIPDLDINYVGTTVTVNEVPIPAAAWLFGSGLLGLVGIARRRSAQAQS